MMETPCYVNNKQGDLHDKHLREQRRYKTTWTHS